jgi:hypothetical protein
MHFEIHWGKCRKWSHSLEDLHEFAKTLKEPWDVKWVIYKIVASKIGGVLNEYELFGSGGIEDVIRQINRGIPKYVIVKKHNTSMDTLNKYIKKYNDLQNENPV